MAEKKKYNSILISGRKDETLTYSRYIKDEESGESVKETLDKKVNVSDELETQQIKDGAITRPKLAEGSVDATKMDSDLMNIIEASVGIPENLIKQFENHSENLAKLNDTVYPITLGFSINPNVGSMQTDVRYSIISDGKPLVPDTFLISKQINDATPKSLSNTPASGGNLSTPIEGAKEIFKLEVGKKGRTGKSTFHTRYLCYHGGNPAATMTAEILNTLSKVSSTGLSFNPKVTTKDNDYIWLVVPSYLSISRVTSAGFDVILTAPQTITNSLGSFKAYRTVNPLTPAIWNLVIS
jgi:hypothetical protein